MTTTTFIAGLTLVLSLMTKIIGFPSQAKKIYDTKDVKSMSLPLYIIIFLSYISWTIHGVMQNDKALIYGQGLGIITTGIILFQIIYYRKKNRQKEIV